MSDAWRVLARNYAKYDTPLRPGDETLAALQGLVASADPLVVVLGATPLFARLAQRVWFVDVADEALRLVAPRPQQRHIRKDWLDASDELAQADLVVGDGAFNALASPGAAERLVHALASNCKPGGTLAQRVFLRHELGPDALRQRLSQSFAASRFSEVRFLVYGIVADANGLVAIADIDRYIAAIETHLDVERPVADVYKAAYFEWRGLSPAAATAITTTAFFPSRHQIEALFEAAGLRVSTRSAGGFPLAEFTPIYVAQG